MTWAPGSTHGCNKLQQNLMEPCLPQFGDPRTAFRLVSKVSKAHNAAVFEEIRSSRRMLPKLGTTRTRKPIDDDPFDDTPPRCRRQKRKNLFAGMFVPPEILVGRSNIPTFLCKRPPAPPPQKLVLELLLHVGGLEDQFIHGRFITHRTFMKHTISENLNDDDICRQKRTQFDTPTIKHLRWVSRELNITKAKENINMAGAFRVQVRPSLGSVHDEGQRY
ncbi:hypothetical protein K474DRAFT_1672307 [Panus rudis PR-1116 ss-1]|nr:hypothetical protein K474DRAFT_1672307 [Panus rudis PR-1116 ss-1]